MRRVSKLLLVVAWVARKSPAQRRRSRGKFLFRHCARTSTMVWLKLIPPLVLLVLKSGFIGVIFFPANAASLVKHQKRLYSPCRHLAKEASAVQSAADMMAASAESAEMAANVVSVRKETDHVGSDREAGVDRASDLKVIDRKVIDHHVHRVTGHHGHHAVGMDRLVMLRQTQNRHHRQVHQRLILEPVRASRGRAKPCYWHRHVQNIADSIAVV